MPLRYVDTNEPGLSRRRCGRGFAYLYPSGSVVRDLRVRRRVEDLAVPPAWRRVWLCRDAWGHIQATGRDARHRKQYIYHPEWRAQRDRDKFGQLEEFGAVLERLREHVDRDLRNPSADEGAVLAAAVRLLDSTGIRAGNVSYFNENGTVGLTTLQDRHVAIDGEHVALRFSAKGGRRARLEVDDRKLARLLLKCEDLPGQRLLRYRCGTEIRELDSAHLNEYLRNISGAAITAKDFRTWIATVTVVEAWLGNEEALGVGEAAKLAARRLCNTAAITRRSYIHPDILRIATERAPTAAELRAGADADGRLSGAERLCRRLLAKH